MRQIALIGPSNWRQAAAARRVTLEEYLRRAYARGYVDFAVHVHACDGDHLIVSIDDTVDFLVHENQLTPRFGASA